MDAVHSIEGVYLEFKFGSISEVLLHNFPQDREKEDVLRQLLEGGITFADAEMNCDRLKAVAAAKVALMREVELETWEEVEASIPEFAKIDELAKFKLHKGKPLSKSFMVSILPLCA